MAKKISSNHLPLPKKEIIKDYQLAYQSRQVSIICRREVLSGKAKFGVFGDGKEIAQLAMARAFQKGDWRSGYYRDQTWMFALGVVKIPEFFAQLFGNTDLEQEPAMGGRSMNAHFATRFVKPDGSWTNQTESYNSAADIANCGAQMPRTVGLAYASVIYRQLMDLQGFKEFSINGNEITWASIGNAATAEGMFWESVNAIGVLHAPAIITIYDDGYGISVPNKYQMVKGNIGALLSGFQREPGPAEDNESGYDLYSVPAWDYPALLETYAKAAKIAQKHHIPALVHVTETTQPLGHSASGSHERYKPPERIKFEGEFDCIKIMREWMINNRVITDDKLAALEKTETQTIEDISKSTWKAYLNPIMEERDQVMDMLDELAISSSHSSELNQIKERLASLSSILRRDIHMAVHEVLRILRQDENPVKQVLVNWKKDQDKINDERFGSHLYSGRALAVAEVKPIYSNGSPTLMGFEVINAAFDAALALEPRLIVFGQDVGILGDVNQGLRGMQEKYGELRVSDTGIRETTILGQAIGMALRGLRPIAEIQYLDYLLYALQIMSDDLANLHWRTVGGQIAPVIVRTRGHRLEGIFHSGSPMAGIIHLVRGMHVLVPRDMTRAAGFYNALLKADEPAIVIEVLNGYRKKEKLPDNIGELITPLGLPEIIRKGVDVTVVTYGACCRILLEAANKLSEVDIDIEVIDVQSLLPFDTQSKIIESLKKTNRILFVDEDMPGGTTAYMLQEVIEKQDGYQWLDSAPKTLTSAAHRPAYGSDGDYWSKPNAETIFDAVYGMMNEVDPRTYPELK